MIEKRLAELEEEDWTEDQWSDTELEEMWRLEEELWAVYDLLDADNA
jgi:hypothetical protein